MLATESRSKPATLGVLPRRYASDSSSFSRRDFMKSPIIGSQATHDFSSVTIVGDELAAKLPSSFLRAVSARLYEENLDGLPGPDAGTDDKAEATPVGGADVAVPMGDTPAAGGATKTGETGCDTRTGKVFSATLNKDDCTKDCSTQHEQKHATDITPCCAKAGEASKAAKAETDKTDIQTKFDDWMISNRPFLECRAYPVSMSCGDAKYAKANCKEKTYEKCCKSLVWYVRSATTEKDKACAQADKKLSDCPFS
jgi:hypothetical protein